MCKFLPNPCKIPGHFLQETSWLKALFNFRYSEDKMKSNISGKTVAIARLFLGYGSVGRVIVMDNITKHSLRQKPKASINMVYVHLSQSSPSAIPSTFSSVNERKFCQYSRHKISWILGSPYPACLFWRVECLFRDDFVEETCI